ncbi:MAG TPA: hypothetical protein VMK12_05610, partial [Anaeromyxobacteraceae bacterium]|nr:hypothetical protein [Anaeromyxobacteraceae bacterium]
FAETWPSSPEARKVFLSVADLREKEGSLSRELRLLEEYQERFAKDPTDWLVIQGRIAKLHARLGSAGGERRAYEEAIRYWHAHQGRVGERALEVVAQAQYLAIEPAFANYERIDFAVPARLSPPRQVRWLKAQLEWKGRKLLDLQKRYTEVVNTKQADPAVCALYKIGLAYERFAHALQSAPLPPEIRHNRALAEEYRAQLRQLAEAPEKKSIEALEYAMTKSRELAVSNACSRAATEVLVRFKPEQYGPPLEKLPEPAPDAVASLPRGHQLTSTRFRPAPHELASSAGEDVRAPLGVAGRSGSTEDSLARDPDVGTEGPAPRRDGSAGSREEDLLP